LGESTGGLPSCLGSFLYRCQYMSCSWWANLHPGCP